MIHYIIPARKGSKGFPLKNRKLLKYTIKSLPKSALRNTIITTDDEYILEEGRKNKIKSFFRNKENSKKNIHTDTSNTKDVLIDTINIAKIPKEDIIILLYLTYPQRTFDDIQDATVRFIMSGARSLLCIKDVKTHPYLCITSDGKQAIKHNLYRRQDYPVFYEISHFIFIARAGEIKKLNKNLYNKNTLWYRIKDKIDVDYEEDFLRL